MKNNEEVEKNGSIPWVPISKDAAKLLPQDRAYTEVEALVSLQLDHNCSNPVTIMGYAALWGWNRKRVMSFLNRLSLTIAYPKDTAKIRKQHGCLMHLTGTRKVQEQGHINFIDFNDLQGKRGKKGARTGTLLIRTEKENKKSLKDPRVRIFQKWWSEKYKARFKKDYLVTNWGQFGSQVKKLLSVLSWTDLQYVAIEFLLDEDKFLIGSDDKNGVGHNIGMLLIRVGQNGYSQYLDAGFRERNSKHIIEEDGHVRSDSKS